MTLSGSGSIAGLVAGGLPDASVTQADLASPVAGNGPACRVKVSSDQSISHNTQTKIQLAQEAFDTNNCFDSSTNYRFTPTVAGYYQLNLNMTISTTSGQAYYVMPQFYKNGAQTCLIEDSCTGNASGRYATNLVDTMYFNGTTDYVEMYAYVYNYNASAGVSVKTDTYFSASLVRAA